MGGHISANGEPGRGATFTFEVPFARVLAGATFVAPAATEPTASGAITQRVHAARILVAEDHTASWFVLQRLLSRRGHEVVRAVDGRQVLALLTQGPFDMALMDCQMPDMDGYEATRRWREHEQATGMHLPIIGMTAATMSESRPRSLGAGMDDHVVKPLSPATLDRLVARWSATGAPVELVDGGVDACRGDVPAGLDVERVQQLRALFPGADMATMVAEMRAEVTRDLDELRAGAAARNAVRVATAAHRIRNTGRVLGAPELVSAAALLDARPSDEPAAAEIDAGAVASLHARWAEAEAALDALLSR
jgi:CheY-like chemotaxis protein